jgi:hypothetical protein
VWWSLEVELEDRACVRFLERVVVVLFRGGVTAGGRCGRRRRDPFPGVRDYELEIKMSLYVCVSVSMCGCVRGVIRARCGGIDGQTAYGAAAGSDSTKSLLSF